MRKQSFLVMLIVDKHFVENEETWRSLLQLLQPPQVKNINLAFMAIHYSTNLIH